jgi:Fanconi-associated nuclease 1
LNGLIGCLDACLSRETRTQTGTKRKLTQRTLLQSSFWSRSKTQASSCESEQLENNLCGGGPDDSLVENASHELQDFGDAEEHDTDLQIQIHMDGGFENPINDDTTRSLSPKNVVSNGDMDVTFDNVSGVTLETFIVGRKFSDEKELDLGARISLLRDPDNVKDHNAIKVTPFAVLFLLCFNR